MANRSAIRDYAREQTLVETDDFADDKVDAVINEGLRVVSSRLLWPWLQTSTTLSVVAGTREYALPADHVYTTALIEQGDSVRLRQVAPIDAWQQIGDDPRSSDPEAYFIWGDTLILTTSPQSNATFDHYYYKQTDVLVDDTDEPAFRSEFHMMLADFAIARMWEREEDFAKARQAQQRFDIRVEEMARAYLRRGSHAPMVFGQRPERGGQRGNMPFLDGV